MLLVDPSTFRHGPNGLGVKVRKGLFTLQLVGNEPFPNARDAQNVVAELVERVVKARHEVRETRILVQHRQVDSNAHRHASLAHQVQNGVVAGRGIKPAPGGDRAPHIEEIGQAHRQCMVHLTCRLAQSVRIAVALAQRLPGGHRVLALCNDSVLVHGDAEVFKQ